MKNKNSRTKWSSLVPVTMCLASMVVAAPAFADNAVKLKVLVIADR